MRSAPNSTRRAATCAGPTSAAAAIAAVVGPIELTLRQGFHPIQIGIGQIRSVELCQA
jgi:hypothetical protein